MGDVDNIEAIFERLDQTGDGVINYSEFLMATIDKQRAVTESNMLFAFHHFDIDNSGSITIDNLKECFRREGRHLNEEELSAIIEQVPVDRPGFVTYEEFRNFMTEILNSAADPTSESSDSDGSPIKKPKLGPTMSWSDV